MSDLEKTVKIIFQGEDKDLVKSISGVASKFDDLGSVADTISAPLAKAADDVLKLDTALAAMVAGGMALAIRESMRMDEAFDAIGTTLNISKDSLGEYQGRIKEYASNSTQSITEITNSISSLIKKGFEYNTALDISKQAEILSVATRSDLKSATDILAETINAYGLSAKDAGRLTDIFTVAVQQGAGALPDLAGSLGKVAGIASTAGVSIEEIIAAVATLGSKGVDTSTAVAGISRTLSNLLEPSSKSAQLAKELGLNFDYTAMKTKGFVGVLQEAYKATGGNAEQLKELFGSVKGLNVAVSLAKDEHDKFKTSLDALSKSAGVATEIFATEARDLDKLFQTLKNNISILLSDIGDKFAPGVAKISDSFVELFKAINKEIDAGAFDPLFDAFDEAAASFDEFIKGIAKALPEALKGLDFSGLLNAIRELFGSLGAYMDGLDLTKPEDLRIALQGVVDTITSLIKITDGMVEGFKPFFDSIKEFVQGINAGDDESKKMAGTVLALAKAIQTFGLGLVAAGELVQQYGMDVKGVFNIIAGASQLLFNEVMTVIDTIKLAFYGLKLAVYEVAGAFGALTFQYTFDKEIAAAKQDLIDLAKETSADVDGIAKGMVKIADGIDQFSGKAKEATKATKELGDQWTLISGKSDLTWSWPGGEALKQKISDIGKEIVKVSDSFPEKKTIEVEAKPDFVEIDGVMTYIGQKIPSKKEIDVKLITDQVQKDSKLIDTAIQWKAKLDIANVEAGTQKAKMMFDSLNLGITSTQTLLNSLFDKYLSATSIWDKSKIEEQIKAENERRKEAFDLQKKLIEQQIEMNKLKLEKMEKGDFSIKIESSGLEPALEMVMWEIIKKVQVRAVESSAEFLLGI